MPTEVTPTGEIELQKFPGCREEFNTTRVSQIKTVNIFLILIY
jgi:hypothetical protein